MAPNLTSRKQILHYLMLYLFLVSITYPTAAESSQQQHSERSALEQGLD